MAAPLVRCSANINPSSLTNKIGERREVSDISIEVTDQECGAIRPEQGILMTCLDELARLSCCPRGLMPSSKPIESIKVCQSSCFASPISKEGNSATLHCKGKGGGKGLQQEERILVGGDGSDTPSLVGEVGSTGPRMAVRLNSVLSWLMNAAACVSGRLCS